MGVFALDLAWTVAHLPPVSGDVLGAGDFLATGTGLRITAAFAGLTVGAISRRWDWFLPVMVGGLILPVVLKLVDDLTGRAISVALNGTSTPINPALVPRDKRLSTADGHYIIFSVTQLRSYLLTTLGKPQIDRASPYDDSFRGKKGIIAFSVNWGDATGHVALFNGQSYREPVHDNYATYFVPRTPTSREVATYRGEFWELNP
jgi:hypothetical protein